MSIVSDSPAIFIDQVVYEAIDQKHSSPASNLPRTRGPAPFPIFEAVITTL